MPKRPLNFKFDVEKFVNLMAHLAVRVDDLDPLKATKLLYLADKHHLVRHGKPILGDFYVRMDYGPVPSLAYSILRDSYNPLQGNEHPSRDSFATSLKVEKRLWERYPKFKAKKPADLEVFSDAELESIEAVINEYGKKTGLELSDLTHGDPPWTDTPNNSLIDYRLFFKNCPAAKEAAQTLLELEQEDREFVSSLNE
jgi:uncharacterized phage-associated protein